jgi:signal transduction histidine kinase
MRLEAGRGIAGYVAASGEVVRVDDANACEYFDRTLARKLGYPVGAVLCVPIHAQGRTLGALELLNKPGGFTADDERLAVLLAGQVGRALVLRQSREEAERKARLATIGQLMAGLLHDLRTPLTVIAGYAEMMASENDLETRSEMSRAILAQLENVSAMQQETLAFARGERTVFVRRVYLQAFMKDLAEQLEQEFAGTDIECKVSTGYTGPARFDETKLRRAIFNLARNAIDAMPKGGRFLVSVEREGDELVFRAQDNGPGIPPEIADRLFESFVTSGKKHGMGLGLAIVRKIAQEHGGAVSCKTKPGKGTTFEIRIPLGLPRG